MLSHKRTAFFLLSDFLLGISKNYLISLKKNSFNTKSPIKIYNIRLSYNCRRYFTRSIAAVYR